MKPKSSYLLAGVVALVVAGWMLSDDFFGKADGVVPQDLASPPPRQRLPRQR